MLDISSIDMGVVIQKYFQLGISDGVLSSFEDIDDDNENGHVFEEECTEEVDDQE